MSPVSAPISSKELRRGMPAGPRLPHTASRRSQRRLPGHSSALQGLRRYTSGPRSRAPDPAPKPSRPELVPPTAVAEINGKPALDSALKMRSEHSRPFSVAPATAGLGFSLEEAQWLRMQRTARPPRARKGHMVEIGQETRRRRTMSRKAASRPGRIRRGAADKAPLATIRPG